MKTRPGPPTTAPAAAATPTLGSAPAPPSPAASPGAADEPPPAVPPPPLAGFATVFFLEAFFLPEDATVGAGAAVLAAEGFETTPTFSFCDACERDVVGVFFLEAFFFAADDVTAEGVAAEAVGAEAVPVPAVGGVEATPAFAVAWPWALSRTRRSTTLTQSMVLPFLPPLRSARLLLASS